MKRILCALLAAMAVISILCLSAFAADQVAYVDYRNGADANSGYSPDAPKKTLGTATGNGSIGTVAQGGTLVVTNLFYVGVDYTLQAYGPITVTANYNGVDYKDSNPKNAKAVGCMKIYSGKILTLESDLIIDDIILLQEGVQNTIVVKDGATLTVTDKVVCASLKDYYIAIEVEAGGTVDLKGGIFSSVTGEGTIKIADNVTILSNPKTDVPAIPDGPQTVCFLDFSNGNNSNDGLTAKTAVKGYKGGCIDALPNGGTLVISGKSYIAGSADYNGYKLPALGGPLTITSVYDGVDYKNPEPEKNPACAFKLGSGTELVINSDIIFDNIILFQENDQNAIIVSPGTTLVVTDTVVFMSKQDYHFRIIIQEGGTAILSEEAQKTFTIENNGTLETYASAAPQKTVVKLTIGQTTGYINGVGKTLDAAPIIANGRSMLPVRFLAEAFGAKVDWDGATSTATITADGVNIVIIIGAATAQINGKTVELDSPAFIQDGRAYLPVRVIADALGAQVDWDGATSTATLTK